MDKLDIDRLTETVGGRFRLTYLVQRRMRELQRGLPPLIADAEGKSWIMIAAEEVARGKVKLVYGEQAQKRRKRAEKPPPPTKEGGES